MSRRSVTTVKIEVTMRLPAGSHPKAAVEDIKLAIAHNTHSQLPGLDLNGVYVKLINKSTTYL